MSFLNRFNRIDSLGIWRNISMSRFNGVWTCETQHWGQAVCYLILVMRYWLRWNIFIVMEFFHSKRRAYRFNRFVYSEYWRLIVVELMFNEKLLPAALWVYWSMSPNRPWANKITYLVYSYLSREFGSSVCHME